MLMEFWMCLNTFNKSNDRFEIVYFIPSSSFFSFFLSSYFKIVFVIFFFSSVCCYLTFKYLEIDIVLFMCIINKVYHYLHIEKTPPNGQSIDFDAYYVIFFGLLS